MEYQKVNVPYYIYFSSDFVSNLKMAIRAETCSSDIYISDNIAVFKTVYPRTVVYLWLDQHNKDDSP